MQNPPGLSDVPECLSYIFGRISSAVGSFMWSYANGRNGSLCVIAQDNGAEQPSARQQLQHIHTPQLIDQELGRLTTDLELVSEQQHQIRAPFQEHHDKIQALLDRHPKASQQELVPQILAISDETHRKIHALLNDHQRELEKAMQQREHDGEENR